VSQALLAELTTFGLGGPAGRLVTATDRGGIVAAVRAADASGEPLLIVGGGSNLLVSDDGVPGTVLRFASRGLALGEEAGGYRLVAVEAGHPWDETVRETLAAGLSGLEALSGIPGLAGATPVQNVGAYGADVSQSLVGVEVFDRVRDRVLTLSNAELAFGYRDSLIKRSIDHGSPRYVVLAVTFRLAVREEGPVAYGQLASALGVELGAVVPSACIREAVLALRASKGMVYDAGDADTHSAGSFFTNPLVAASVAAGMPDDAPRFPAAGGLVKLSAAWLIEHAGFAKGYGLPGTPGEAVSGGRASLSTKHTLALTNRGSASAADVVALARHVRDGVVAAWGVELHAEPLFIGCTL